jgi:hypothetical protein
VNKKEENVNSRTSKIGLIVPQNPYYVPQNPFNIVPQNP